MNPLLRPYYMLHMKLIRARLELRFDQTCIKSLPYGRRMPKSYQSMDWLNLKLFAYRLQEAYKKLQMVFTSAITSFSEAHLPRISAVVTSCDLTCSKTP